MTDTDRAQIINQILQTTTGQGSLAMIEKLGLPDSALIEMLSDVLWAIENAGFNIVRSVRQ